MSRDESTTAPMLSRISSEKLREATGRDWVARPELWLGDGPLAFEEGARRRAALERLGGGFSRPPRRGSSGAKFRPTSPQTA